MKKLLLLASFFLSFSAMADYSVRFDRVPLSQLAKVVFGEIMQKSYLIDDDIIDKEVSIRLVRFTPEKMFPVISAYLESKGVYINDVQGVLLLSSGEKPDSFVYVPKNRTVKYVREVLAPFLNGSANVQSQAPGANVVVNQQESGVESLVFSGLPGHLEKIKKALKTIDVPPGELLIKASVYEVATNRVDSSAVDLVLGLLKSSRGLGVSVTGGASSDNAIKLQVGDVSAVWSALSSDTRFKLVSSPTVRIKSGGRSRFVAGADVPVLGSVTYQGDNAVQAVEYKTSGVVLELSPVVRDGVTDLNIVQQISQFVATQNGVNNSPTLTKRELTTDVTVTGDELIILGGLDEMTEKTGDSGLSFLPAFMRADRAENSRTEVLILLNVQRI